MAAPTHCSLCTSKLGEALVLKCNHDVCVRCAAHLIDKNHFVICTICGGRTQVDADASRTLSEIAAESAHGAPFTRESMVREKPYGLPPLSTAPILSTPVNSSGSAPVLSPPLLSSAYGPAQRELPDGVRSLGPEQRWHPTTLRNPACKRHHSPPRKSAPLKCSPRQCTPPQRCSPRQCTPPQRRSPRQCTPPRHCSPAKHCSPRECSSLKCSPRQCTPPRKFHARRQCSPSGHCCSPRVCTPPRQCATGRCCTSTRGNTPPRVGSLSRENTPPRQNMPSRDDTPSRAGSAPRDNGSCPRKEHAANPGKEHSADKSGRCNASPCSCRRPSDAPSSQVRCPFESRAGARLRCAAPRPSGTPRPKPDEHLAELRRSETPPPRPNENCTPEGTPPMPEEHLPSVGEANRPPASYLAMRGAVCRQSEADSASPQCAHRAPHSRYGHSAPVEKNRYRSPSPAVDPMAPDPVTSVSRGQQQGTFEPRCRCEAQCNFWCSECNELICSECAVVSIAHKNHSILTAAKAATYVQANVDVVMSQLKATAEQIGNDKQKLDDAERQVKSYLATSQAKLRQAVVEAQERLAQFETNLTKEMDATGHGALDAIRGLRDEANTQTQRIDEVGDQLLHAVESLNDVGVLSQYSQAENCAADAQSYLRQMDARFVPSVAFASTPLILSCGQDVLGELPLLHINRNDVAHFHHSGTLRDDTGYGTASVAATVPDVSQAEHAMPRLSAMESEGIGRLTVPRREGSMISFAGQMQRSAYEQVNLRNASIAEHSGRNASIAGYPEMQRSAYEQVNLRNASIAEHSGIQRSAYEIRGDASLAEHPGIQRSAYGQANLRNASLAEHPGVRRSAYEQANLRNAPLAEQPARNDAFLDEHPGVQRSAYDIRGDASLAEHPGVRRSAYGVVHTELPDTRHNEQPILQRSASLVEHMAAGRSVYAAEDPRIGQGALADHPDLRQSISAAEQYVTGSPTELAAEQSGAAPPGPTRGRSPERHLGTNESGRAVRLPPGRGRSGSPVHRMAFGGMPPERVNGQNAPCALHTCASYMPAGHFGNHCGSVQRFGATRSNSPTQHFGATCNAAAHLAGPACGYTSHHFGATPQQVGPTYSPAQHFRAGYPGAFESSSATVAQGAGASGNLARAPLPALNYTSANGRFDEYARLRVPYRPFPGSPPPPIAEPRPLRSPESDLDRHARRVSFADPATADSYSPADEPSRAHDASTHERILYGTPPRAQACAPTRIGGHPTYITSSYPTEGSHLQASGVPQTHLPGPQSPIFGSVGQHAA